MHPLYQRVVRRRDGVVRESGCRGRRHLPIRQRRSHVPNLSFPSPECGGERLAVGIKHALLDRRMGRRSTECLHHPLRIVRRRGVERLHHPLRVVGIVQPLLFNPWHSLLYAGSGHHLARVIRAFSRCGRLISLTGGGGLGRGVSTFLFARLPKFKQREARPDLTVNRLLLRLHRCSRAGRLALYSALGPLLFKATIEPALARRTAREMGVHQALSAVCVLRDWVGLEHARRNVALGEWIPHGVKRGHHAAAELR
mmetsp:Transcript_41329/g.100275  ORF Transcript_41329/g.100275 Transcript_41329/m.100275 type:complete len:255 (-) Transcript_41329:486-1250(-)